MPSIYVDSRGILPKRSEYDLYPSQRALIRAAIPHLAAYRATERYGYTPFKRSPIPFRILDLGAGDDCRWGVEAKRYFSQYYSTVILTGVEIRDVPKPDGVDIWFGGTNALEWTPPQSKYNLSIGNPPFYIDEELVRLSTGIALETIFLLPRDFGGGTKRHNGLHKDVPVFQECPSARRPSFSGDNKTGATVYSMWHWRSGQGEPNAWMTRGFNWETDPADIIPVALEIRKIRDQADRKFKKNRAGYLEYLDEEYARRLVHSTFSTAKEEADFLWRLKGYIDHVREGLKEDVQKPQPA